MSVFRVKLNNNAQGLLDVDPTTGLQSGVSNQRTISVNGPNKVLRVLADGETFTDCNYWKQFAYPQVSLENAFIEVVSDDGSVWSATSSENVFPLVWLPGDDGVVAAGAAPEDDNMSLDIVAEHGGPALFVQIKNNDSSDSIKVKLNGSTSAVFTLDANSTQIFNHGDLVITEIAFDNSASGTNEVDNIEVLLSVKSVPTS